MVPDFLIGAHAVVRAGALLTRAKGFYRAHFKKLSIVEPTAASKKSVVNGASGSRARSRRRSKHPILATMLLGEDPGICAYRSSPEVCGAAAADT